MRTQAILAAILVLPLMFLQACNRADHSPTASGSSQEKKAMTPSSPDKAQEGAPASSAGPMSTTPPAVPPADNAAPATPQSEPKKSY